MSESLQETPTRVRRPPQPYRRNRRTALIAGVIAPITALAVAACTKESNAQIGAISSRSIAAAQSSAEASASASQASASAEASLSSAAASVSSAAASLSSAEASRTAAATTTPATTTATSEASPSRTTASSTASSSSSAPAPAPAPVAAQSGNWVHPDFSDPSTVNSCTASGNQVLLHNGPFCENPVVKAMSGQMLEICDVWVTDPNNGARVEWLAIKFDPNNPSTGQDNAGYAAASLFPDRVDNTCKPGQDPAGFGQYQ